MEKVTVEEARKRLGDLVIAAQARGEVTVITRYGRPAAVIAPLPSPCADDDD